MVAGIDQVPSDDQDPTPVYFLAVKAEAAFVFPFRLAPLPEGGLSQTREELTKQVSGWLESALKTLGAGAQNRRGLRLLPELRHRVSPEGSTITPIGAKVRTPERSAIRKKSCQEKSMPSPLWPFYTEVTAETVSD